MFNAPSGDSLDGLPRRRCSSDEVSPEDVLLAWLLWLPSDADPARAAIAELRRPAFHHHLADRRLARLADLLREVAATPAGSIC
jgi:hypothetical protein